MITRDCIIVNISCIALSSNCCNSQTFLVNPQRNESTLIFCIVETRVLLCADYTHIVTAKAALRTRSQVNACRACLIAEANFMPSL